MLDATERVCYLYAGTFLIHVDAHCMGKGLAVDQVVVTVGRVPPAEARVHTDQYNILHPYIITPPNAGLFLMLSMTGLSWSNVW